MAKDALRIDKANGNTLWQDAIAKELGQINNYKVFRKLEDDDVLPVGYKKIPYHIVFDVKLDFRRKARLVAGGNHTDPPKDDVYSGVI